jgi:chaperonin cofactor prefoldin
VEELEKENEKLEKESTQAPKSSEKDQSRISDLEAQIKLKEDLSKK